MRRQIADYDCGPTAVANALACHGRRVGLRGLQDITGCEPNGSDEQAVLRALLAYGCDVDAFESSSAPEARAWLRETLAAGRPALLCVDRWGHWITVIGALGAKVTVYDPSEGASVRQLDSLCRRWRAARRVRRQAGAFYGVAVGVPTR